MYKSADMEVVKRAPQIVPMPRPFPARRRVTIRRPQEQPVAGLHGWIQDFLASWRLVALSAVIVGVAVYCDYRCGMYVSSTAGVKVPDLILDHLPPIDLGPLFVYGYGILISVMFLYPIFFRVRMLHWVAIQFSLLLLLRSVAMMFTHMETPAGAVAVGFPWVFKDLYFDNDMFFSGHTAMPFLGFYLFKGSPLRYVFLVGAVAMGMTALAMHLHYSIDVFSAFFITYCSYKMGSWVFRRIDPARLE